jgi:hypothetical protein
MTAERSIKKQRNVSPLWQRGREPIYATENRHDTTPPEECSLFKIPRPQLSPSIVTEGATLRNDHGVITPINTPAVHILESHSWDSVPSRSWAMMCIFFHSLTNTLLKTIIQPKETQPLSIPSFHGPTTSLATGFLTPTHDPYRSLFSRPVFPKDDPEIKPIYELGHDKECSRTSSCNSNDVVAHLRNIKTQPMNHQVSLQMGIALPGSKKSTIRKRKLDAGQHIFIPPEVKASLTSKTANPGRKLSKAAEVLRNEIANVKARSRDVGNASRAFQAKKMVTAEQN